MDPLRRPPITDPSDAMSPASRRVDLFVLPSETDGRFRFLIVAAVILAANLGTFSWDLVRGTADRARIGALREAYGGLRDLDTSRPDEMVTFQREYRAMTQETVKITVPQLLAPLPFLAALGLGFWGLYVTHPLRLRWRHRPQPLRQDQAPRVVGYLRRCAERFELRSLSLEWRSRLTIFGGCTYGLPGREVLLLDGEPSRLEKRWEEIPAFKAVALHELAHVVHRDTNRDRAASIWQAAAALVALAFIAAAFHPTPRNDLAAIGWRFAILLIFALAIWAGVIRRRELYADWRVASWGSGNELEWLFVRLRERSASWGKRLLRVVFHPSFMERKVALNNPLRLFRVSPDLPFITGILLSLLATNALGPFADLLTTLTSFGVLALPQQASAQDTAWLTAKLLLFHAVPFFLPAVLALGALSFLVTGVLGTQVQRESLTDLVQRKRDWGYRRLLGPAFLLALGAEIGFLISPLSPVPTLWAEPVGLVFWLVAFALLAWLWLVYLRAATRITASLRISKAVPRAFSRIRWTGTFLLVGLLVPLVIARWALTTARLPVQEWHLGQLNPEDFKIYMLVMTPLMFLILALTLFLLWCLTELGMAALSLRQCRSRCWACDEVSEEPAVGRSCHSCGKDLSPWIYARDAADPGR